MESLILLPSSLSQPLCASRKFHSLPPARSLQARPLLSLSSSRSSFLLTHSSPSSPNSVPSLSSCSRSRLGLVNVFHRATSESSTSTASISTKVEEDLPNSSKNIIESIVGFFRDMLGGGGAEQRSEKRGEEEGGEEEVSGGRTVFVAGGTGRTGRKIVKRLVEGGHRVVVLASSLERANEVLAEGEGLELVLASEEEVGEEGMQTKTKQKEARKAVKVVVGDLNNEAALRKGIDGCDGIICCVAARFGPDGYSPESTPRAVYGEGICQLIRAAQRTLAEGGDEAVLESIFDFSAFEEVKEAEGEDGEEEGKEKEEEKENGAAGRVRAEEDGRVEGWRRLDDVIMGGISESTFRPGNGCVTFEGVVRVEGGGFCGTRAILEGAPRDFSSFDGIKLRVRGDGQRYKINLRDNEQVRGEYQHQASFDTVRGKWVDVFIPFDRFRGVERSRPVAGAPPPNTTSIYSIGLVLSRFQYDGFPNLLFNPGTFKLEIESISAYKNPLPQFLLVSSAAVERSARVSGSIEERECSIPIVKLNPGGVLSWKLTSEDFLRSSGMRYCIVRPCGLNDEDEGPFLLEVGQGDALTGRISRNHTAAVCVEALASPDVVNTTFEVRRDDLTKGFEMKDWSNLFRRLRPDRRPSIVQYPLVPEEISSAFKG